MVDTSFSERSDPASAAKPSPESGSGEPATALPPHCMDGTPEETESVHRGCGLLGFGSQSALTEFLNDGLQRDLAAVLVETLKRRVEFGYSGGPHSSILQIQDGSYPGHLRHPLKFMTFPEQGRDAESGCSSSILRLIAVEIHLKELVNELERSFQNRLRGSSGEWASAKADWEKASLSIPQLEKALIKSRECAAEHRARETEAARLRKTADLVKRGERLAPFAGAFVSAACWIAAGHFTGSVSIVMLAAGATMGGLAYLALKKAAEAVPQMEKDIQTLQNEDTLWNRAEYKNSQEYRESILGRFGDLLYNLINLKTGEDETDRCLSDVCAGIERCLPENSDPSSRSADIVELLAPADETDILTSFMPPR